MPTPHSTSTAVPTVRRLACNAFGRDFIASDLHGCHRALMQALDAARFDPDAGDRLLLGGDLIDRGAESLQCLRMLREPWVHACLGNHEAMLLTWLGRRHSDWHDSEEFTDNGGAWAEALLETASRRDLEEFAELATVVEQLPLVLAVEDTAMPFNVAHTDLQPLVSPVRTRGRRRQATLQERLCQLEPIPSELADPALWSRALAFELEGRCSPGARACLAGDVLIVSDKPVEPGLALTYVGHTPAPALRLHRSRLFIDRGAVYTNATDSQWRLALLEHRRVVAGLGDCLPRRWIEKLAANQAINSCHGMPISRAGLTNRVSDACVA